MVLGSDQYGHDDGLGSCHSILQIITDTSEHFYHISSVIGYNSIGGETIT